MPAITNAFRLLQSSHAKGINIQQKRTGNLFQQKTKSKLVSGQDNYTRNAFLYIHRNPVEAGLVKFPGEWELASWKEYFQNKNSSLCNTIAFLQLPCIIEKPVTKGMEGRLSSEDEAFLF